jgi:MFS family permease
MRQQLDAPLTTITLLFTINSAGGLAATSAGGPLVDRFSRKGAMVLALVVSGATLAALSRAGTLAAWALLQALSGAANPLFRVGSNAMVADLVGPPRRPAACALLRIVSKVGVAIGPSVGGLVTSVSHSLAPVATWYGGLAMGLAAAVGFLLLARREHAKGALEGGQDQERNW